MQKNNQDACDWCGKVFSKSTSYTKYTDGTCYHYACLKKVGGRTDLGREQNV